MSLSKIRDIIIIVGIYLYFMSWVYLHYYYDSFGISTSSLKIDYSAYIVYSYFVISSWAFVKFAVLVLAGVVTGVVFFDLFRTRKMNSFKRWLETRYPFLLVTGMILVFPFLYSISVQTAIAHARTDRFNNTDRPVIQFTFRKGADGLSPVADPGSVAPLSADRQFDIDLLRTDSIQSLQLLGESDRYYIVLRQPKFNQQYHLYPAGAVYYLDKSDILLSKIILK